MILEITEAPTAEFRALLRGSGDWASRCLSQVAQNHTFSSFVDEASVLLGTLESRYFVPEPLSLAGASCSPTIQFRHQPKLQIPKYPGSCSNHCEGVRTVW